jgi:oligoribonuclease (3'-5' exoribonuclease)
MPGPAYFLFLDLECTGLDQCTGSILELAFILTDVDLVEIARFQTSVNPLPGYDDMDPVVLKMHTKNGLLQEIREGGGVRRYQAEELALQVIETHCKLTPKLTIAGNSVWFDKNWLKEHMPKLHDRINYRIFDITTINTLAQIVNPDLFQGRPRGDDNHRAMSDTQNSLEMARYYMGVFRPATFSLKD